jgi:Lrp/AsnC family leucine-responsive transcriptional regulator
VRLKARSGTAGVDDKLRTIPNIVEANRVTGSDSHVLRAHIRTAHELEELLTDVWDDGETITNIVTSSPVPRRPMNLRATDAGREIG